MKSSNRLGSAILSLYFIIIFLGFDTAVFAQVQETQEYRSFSGLVIDSKTKRPLEFAGISVKGTHISTVTNTDGEFLLKVPVSELDSDITITYLGYYNKVVPISELKPEKNVFKLDESIVKIPEVNLSVKDPDLLIDKMLEKLPFNYLSEPTIMTAFYRETIKKGKRRYASLSEAVVEIYKASYKSQSREFIKLYKARKSTDYKRLDTLLMKLQGGPYNLLNFDLVKNRYLLLSDDIKQLYRFSFDQMIFINNRPTYVVSFKQYESIDEPLYYGKLYIDSATYALVKAVISLNLDNPEEVAKYFVRKKPAKVKVLPFRADYYIDYRMKRNKWYFNYGRIELAFKVDYPKKLFNSNYYVTAEMAVTDWVPNTEKKVIKGKERLRTNVVLADEASGFSDPEFWGEYNVIEPEKSIEVAIKKIKRQLKRSAR